MMIIQRTYFLILPIQTFNPAAKARIIHAPKKPMLGSPTVDFIGDVRARNEPERYKKRNP